jgi:hypothetical protein
MPENITELPSPHAAACLSVNENEICLEPASGSVAIVSLQTYCRGTTLAQPFIVSIPHKLGKEEATRRLKAGLGSVRSEYGKILQITEEIWSGDRLAFHLIALKQQVSGAIEVAEDHVKLEVMLPWLLAGLAHGIQATIRSRATRMLEKKTTDV